MTAATDYLENELLDHVLGTGAFTMPVAAYLGLFTAAPSDAGGGTEVAGNGYARQDVTFGAAASGTSSNTAQHTFTASGGNWGSITHFALFDALTVGNMLIWGALTTARPINDGESLVLAIGDLDISLD